MDIAMSGHGFGEAATEAEPLAWKKHEKASEKATSKWISGGKERESLRVRRSEPQSEARVLKPRCCTACGHGHQLLNLNCRSCPYATSLCRQMLRLQKASQICQFMSIYVSLCHDTSGLARLQLHKQPKLDHVANLRESRLLRGRTP